MIVVGASDNLLFKTTEAARISGLSLNTIIRSMEKGLLKGFRIPGSRHRRIPEAALREFLVQNRIPTEELEREIARRKASRKPGEKAGPLDHLSKEEIIEWALARDKPGGGEP